MTSIRLPEPNGSLTTVELRDPGAWTRPSTPIRSRVAYAAAHVVPQPLADNAPGAPAAIDWDTTLRDVLTDWRRRVPDEPP